MPRVSSITMWLIWEVSNSFSFRKIRYRKGMGLRAIPRFCRLVLWFSQKDGNLKIVLIYGEPLQILEYHLSKSGDFAIIYHRLSLTILVLNFFSVMLVLQSHIYNIIKLKKNFESQKNDINDNIFNSH